MRKIDTLFNLLDKSKIQNSIHNKVMKFLDANKIGEDESFSIQTWIVQEINWSFTMWRLANKKVRKNK